MKIDIEQKFHNRQDAENWKRGYLNAYPTEGYGTRLNVVHGGDPDGFNGLEFKVVGSRFDSAD